MGAALTCPLPVKEVFKMSAIFKDFDKLIPEARVAKLAGKEIDVSKLPSRTSIEMAIFRDRIFKGQITSEEAALKSIEIVAQACAKTNPELGINTDWLLDNTHHEQLIAFMDFVLEPINRPDKSNKSDKKDKKK
jgi:hypothetical protein